MKETARRSAYLREAAVQLFMARTAVSLLPARYVLRHAGRPPRQLSRFRNEEIAWIVWAVQEAATRARLAGTALPPALAIQSMMRRRGIASRLCLGVERAAGHAVSRAWVEADGRAVGGIDVSGIVRVAEFGSAGGAQTAAR